MKTAVEQLVEDEESRLGDRFAPSVLGLDQVARTLTYLEIILADYRAAVEPFLEAMDAKFAMRGAVRIDASQYAAERQLATVLHLRIETFYLYAKVLADRLAKAVELFFGQARGISLTKHSRIRTKLAQFAEAHGLDPPPAYLLEKADEVTKQIADFRDRHVVHEQNPRRSWATGFDREAREASLSPFTLRAKENEEPGLPGASPTTLMAVLDTYTVELVDYLRRNASRREPANEQSAGS